MAMRLEGCEVAVIGAGIGGLAAALALAQRRAWVQVFERLDTGHEVGAGIQIAPNGVAVLEALGLRDAVETVASLPAGVELCDHADGRLVAQVPLGQSCVARYGRPYWHVHRADLLRLLAQAARAAGVEIVGGTQIRALRGFEEKPACVAADGTVHGADLVIAADGMGSRVRRSYLAGEAPRFTGHVAWRGLVDASKLPKGAVPDGARVTMGPGRHVVTYPLRGGSLVNFVAVEARGEWAAERWRSPGDPDELRAAFAGWDARTRALLQAVEEIYLWGLFDHPPLPAWVRGRVALLGDACHPMLPFLAQGATMALEDAWVLAAELDVGETPERGLLAYEARRAPRAGRVQRASAGNGRVYHLANPVLRAGVHRALGAVARVAPGQLLRRFDWIYGADVVSAGATM